MTTVATPATVPAAKAAAKQPARKSTTRSKTAPTKTVQEPLRVERDPKVRARAASLSTKAPTDLHVDMARWISELTGVEVSPKMAQLVANLRMDYQRSESNKARDEYKGLEVEEVDYRSIHMIQANKDAKAAIAKRLEEEAKAAAKAAKPVRKPRAPKAKVTPVATAATPSE